MFVKNIFNISLRKIYKELLKYLFINNKDFINYNKFIN